MQQQFRYIVIFLIIFSWIFSGWPPAWQNSLFPTKIEPANALNKATNWNFNGNSTGWTATNSNGTNVCADNNSSNADTGINAASSVYNGNIGGQTGYQLVTTTGKNIKARLMIAQTVAAPGSGTVKAKGKFSYYGSSTAWNATGNTSWVRLDLFDASNASFVASLGCVSFNSSQAWTTTSFSSDASLTGGTTYTIRATLRGNNKNTTGSAAVTVAVDNIVVNFAPVGLSASAVAGTTNVSLSWTASSAGTGANGLHGTTPYKVYRDGASPVSTFLANATTNSYTDSSTSGNTTYYYAISDVDTASDESPLSAEASVLTYPAAPTSLSFSSITANTLRLSWSGSATSYKVARCSGASCTPTEVYTGVTDAFKDDSGLTCNTLYRYKVLGTNATGDGVYSSIAEQTTGACGPSITAPASVQMPNYTLGGAGYAERNFSDVSGLIQVTASAGFTVQISSTALTGSNNTIAASSVKLKTDGTAASNPTQIINCSGFSGISETGSGELGLDSARTIVTTTSGSGTCDIYPTIRVYFDDKNTYVEQDSGTLTFTVF